MTGLTHQPDLVLLLEDDAVTSLALEDCLLDAGFDVQVIGSCADALLGLQFLVPDAAILDVSLRGETCREVADRLQDLGVPFLIYSGRQAHEGLLPDYPGVEWLEKPISPPTIIAALQRLLGGRHPAFSPRYPTPNETSA